MVGMQHKSPIPIDLQHKSFVVASHGLQEQSDRVKHLRSRKQVFGKRST